MTQPTILIVPGRGNSGAGHWQSLVERRFPRTQRVVQDNWASPGIDAWARRLDEVVREHDPRPLLVAHSFGCLAAAYAQITLGTPVGATLFVAPADPRRFGLPERVFSEQLMSPGFLIASDNDPWMSTERAIAMANVWGVRHITLKNAGHINVASGHGPWPFGESIIRRMRQRLGEADTLPAFEPIFRRQARPSFTHPGEGVATERLQRVERKDLSNVS